MSRYIVSANYRDRSSKYKWLVREEGQHPNKAIAVTDIVMIGVAICPATDWETGFGCSTIAVCDDVEYKAEDVEPAVEEVELYFSGHTFKNKATGNVIERMDEMTLSRDGSMSAKLKTKAKGKKRLSA